MTSPEFRMPEPGVERHVRRLEDGAYLELATLITDGSRVVMPADFDRLEKEAQAFITEVSTYQLEEQPSTFQLAIAPQGNEFNQTVWLLRTYEINETSQAEAIPLKRTTDGWQLAGDADVVDVFRFIRERAAAGDWRISLGFRVPTVPTKQNHPQPLHPLCDEFEAMRLAVRTAARDHNQARLLAASAVGQLVGLSSRELEAARAAGLFN